MFSRHLVVTLLFLVFSTSLQANSAPVDVFNTAIASLHTPNAPKVLSLSGEGLDSRHLEQLANALTQNNTLNKLDLSNNWFYDEGAEIILKALKDNTTLKSLSLNNNFLVGDNVNSFIHLLHANHHLTDLSLTNNFIVQPNINVLLNSLKENKTLKKLKLGNNHNDSNLPFTYWPATIDAIVALINKNNTLESLDISSLSPTDGFNQPLAEQLARALAENKTLKKINLSGHHLTDEGTASIVTALINHPQLKSLLLNHTQVIGAKATQALAHYLAKNNTVTTLDVGSSRITSEAAQSLAAGLRQNKQLKVLDISANNIAALGVHSMLAAIAAHPTLEEIYLDNLNLNAQFIDLMLQLLSGEKSLSALSLSNNPLHDEFISAIAPKLATNNRLKVLSIDRTGFTSSGGRALGAALAANQHLKVLTASHNAIDEETLRGLLTLLKRNHSLEFLDVSANHYPLSDNIAPLFANIIKTHQTLKGLSFEAGKMSEHALKPILTAVKTNPNFLWLDLGTAANKPNLASINEMIQSVTALNRLRFCANGDKNQLLCPNNWDS